MERVINSRHHGKPSTDKKDQFRWIVMSIGKE
jgi:hypothetical protein